MSNVERWRSRSLGLLLIGGLAWAPAACSKVSYVAPSTTPNGKVVEETGHYFLLGLLGSKDLDATKLCPEGVARAQSRFSFGDSLAAVVTMGLYTPRTYRLACGSKGGE